MKVSDKKILILIAAFLSIYIAKSVLEAIDPASGYGTEDEMDGKRRTTERKRRTMGY